MKKIKYLIALFFITTSLLAQSLGDGSYFKKDFWTLSGSNLSPRLSTWSLTGITNATVTGYLQSPLVNLTDGTDTYKMTVSADKWVLQNDAVSPTSLIVVDSSGNVGIGTSPGTKLNIGLPAGVSTLNDGIKLSRGTGYIEFVNGTTSLTDFTAMLTGYSNRSSNPGFVLQGIPVADDVSNIAIVIRSGSALSNSDILEIGNYATSLVRIKANGNVGIGVTSPTAVLHLKAGTATANTAPLKFTSGTLLTTPEAGAVEFLTDAYYATITTGLARKTFAFLESPTFTGTVGGITATMVGLGNVTNESKATMFTSPTFTGTVIIPTPFTLGAVSITATGTELNHVIGVTSAIQTQLNAKQGTLTNSAGLASAISDETGTGLVVFGTNPTIVKPTMDATNPSAQTYTPAAAGTATIDGSLSNAHRITMPAGNITIAVTNITNAQEFTISITQDGIGSRLVTWFTTIRWTGGAAPTLTTTANKRDVFRFERTGVDTYDGFVIGQNL